MTPNPVHERRLTKMAPPPLTKRKLNIILPLPPNFTQLPHPLRHIHLLKLGVITDALEERHTESLTLTLPWTQHPMGRRPAHPSRQRLQALTHRHDQRAFHGRTVDPFPLLILRLQPHLWRRLQQVARQHRVLVWAHSLAVDRVITVSRAFRILYEFQLVLLICVEEAGEGGWGHIQCLRDQGSEEGAYA